MIRNQTSRGDSYLWDMFNQLTVKIWRQLKGDFSVLLAMAAGSLPCPVCCFWGLAHKAARLKLLVISDVSSLTQRFLEHPRRPATCQPARSCL